MIQEVDLGLKITSTLLIKIAGKVFMVMGEVDIGIRPATLSSITQVTMIDLWVYLLLLFLFTNFFMVTNKVIIVAMMEEGDLGLNIPETLSLRISEKVLMVMGEVDIGLRPEIITPIMQLNVVDFCVYLLLLTSFKKTFMVIKEIIVVATIEDVDLGHKRPANIPFKTAEKVLIVT